MGPGTGPGLGPGPGSRTGAREQDQGPDQDQGPAQAELRAADLLVGEWELEIAPNHTCTRLEPSMGIPQGNPHGSPEWNAHGEPMRPPWEIPTGPPQGVPMGNPHREGKSPWGHGAHGESPYMGNPHWYKNSQWEPLRHDEGGRVELSHGRFLLDLGIFAWVEQALDMAGNRSILYRDSTFLPASNPRPEAWGRAGFGQDGGLARPGQKCPSRDSARSQHSGWGR